MPADNSSEEPLLDNGVTSCRLLSIARFDDVIIFQWHMCAANGSTVKDSHFCSRTLNLGKHTSEFGEIAAHSRENCVMHMQLSWSSALNNSNQTISSI